MSKLTEQMFVLANQDAFRHRMVDAGVRSDADIKELTGLHRNTIGAMRRGDPASYETVRTIMDALEKAAAERRAQVTQKPMGAASE